MQYSFQFRIRSVTFFKWLGFYPWIMLTIFFGGLKTPFAFNFIHEASYNLIPRGNFKSTTTLSAGAVVRSESKSVYDMPFAIALQATPRIELGARVQTRWGDIEDHVPYLAFGVKWLTLGYTSVQADLLVGANANSGKGFSLSTYHKFSHTAWLYSRLLARIGFMEALVEEDGLAAMEVAYHPTVVIGKGIGIECGIIGSSQTKNFDRYFAMDIQPAVHVKFGRDSELETAVAFGLTGNRQEEMHVMVAINHGI